MSTNQVEINKVKFRLNNQEKTAEIIGSDYDITDLNVPTFISYNNQNYIVKSISQNAFKNIFNSSLSSISFSADSQLQTIEESAFYYCQFLTEVTIPSSVKSIKKEALQNFLQFSYCFGLTKFEIPIDSKLEILESNSLNFTSIESLSIPSQVTKIEPSFASRAQRLREIKVNPSNQYYKSYDDKFILSKSNPKGSDFDSLFFCVGNIQSVTIPNFIKYLCPHVFYGNTNITRIKFQWDSKLQEIGDGCFGDSSIVNISIPSSVSYLGKQAFFQCEKLKSVFFNNDSLVQKFYDGTFSFSKIVSIIVPPKVTLLESGTFASCDYLKIVLIEENSELPGLNLKAFKNSYSPNLMILAQSHFIDHIKL